MLLLSQNRHSATCTWCPRVFKRILKLGDTLLNSTLFKPISKSQVKKGHLKKEQGTEGFGSNKGTLSQIRDNWEQGITVYNVHINIFRKRSWMG